MSILFLLLLPLLLLGTAALKGRQITITQHASPQYVLPLKKMTMIIKNAAKQEKHDVLHLMIQPMHQLSVHVRAQSPVMMVTKIP